MYFVFRYVHLNVQHYGSAIQKRGLDTDISRLKNLIAIFWVYILKTFFFSLSSSYLPDPPFRRESINIILTNQEIKTLITKMNLMTHKQTTTAANATNIDSSSTSRHKINEQRRLHLCSIWLPYNPIIPHLCMLLCAGLQLTTMSRCSDTTSCSSSPTAW